MTSPSDIVVVGAGIVGCAIAYELARRGASVAIVDDRAPAMGATQASAGILAPFVEARDGGPLLDLAARSLELYDEFVANVAEDSGCAIHYLRTGTLEVAMSGDALSQFAVAREALAARGIAAELLEAAAVRAHEPNLSSDALGGLLIPIHGFTAAGALTRALVAGARRHGARWVEQTRVRALSQSVDCLLIETDHGPLRARHVVVAAGSWAGNIDIDGATTRVPVRPIRGQLLHLGWSGPPLGRVVWSERCYLVPWPDHTVLVGATVEDVGFDERTSVAGVRDLIDAACELVPRVWTAGFIAARVGLRPATPDHLPIIGASTVLPDVMYATGHYRNGVLLAPLTAKLVADAMLDRRRDPMLEWTTPGRFGAI